MLELPERIVVFDTEYTSWPGAQERDWSGLNEYREIVHIGAVLVETATFTELDCFDVFVRPRRNPVLSDFFVTLTAITQARVDREGIDFGAALQKFFAWCGEHLIFSWGHDADVLRENCELLGIAFPFNAARFRNAKNAFAAAGIPVDQYQSSTIVRAFGKEPSRRGHNALNDARTIADGFRELMKRVRAQ